MGEEIVLMVVVAFACAAIGYGALHFAAKLPTPRLGGKSDPNASRRHQHRSGPM
jgi:hypothetical protein